MPLVTGDTVEECTACVSAIYDDFDFIDKNGFILAQVDAIMKCKTQSRPYPDFLPESETRVYLRDYPDYAYDTAHGVIFNVTTKQIIQPVHGQVNLKGDSVYVHIEGLRACTPKPIYANVSVDHISRDHTDHRLENLRWAPASLQCKNRHTKESLDTSAIQAKKDGEEWKTYKTRKEFVQSLGLPYLPSCANLSTAISNGVKFHGHRVRNLTPTGIGQLRPIPASVVGIDGYQATEFGGYIRRPNGTYTHGSKESRCHYYKINIDGSPYKVHILTTYAFHGSKPSPNSQSNHKRGAANGPADARDLEWVTRSENVQHAHDVGLNTSSRAVVAISDNTTKRFSSSLDAVRYFKARGIKVDNSAITKSCNGKQKSHKGITWAYADGTTTSRKRKFIDDE
ncbi:hypothetical protein JKP88DRAFT_240984 [Tribonema minus]|uniref:HNH nuclease domain-containing protein n=1 Tax=Tribonema minus TaxID=303371 RepID=A0A835Z7H9_9STRA|nr:hypothetical protein JKP88DRAFT_240984 [Tribonema minus]